MFEAKPKEKMFFEFFMQQFPFTTLSIEVWLDTSNLIRRSLSSLLDWLTCNIG